MPDIVLTSLAVIVRILANPLANVFQKRLTINGFHPLLINFLSYFGLSIICLSIALSVSWAKLPADFWRYSIVGGIAGALGNGFLVKALQKGDLSILGPINAYKSVVGLMVGIFLLNEIPNIWGAIGTVLIIGGSYFVLETTADKFSWTLFKRKEIQFRLWALILTAIEAVLIKKVILSSNVNIAFISWCWFGALFSFLMLPLNRLNVSAEIRHLSIPDSIQFVLLILCIGIMQLTTNYMLGHMPVGYALALFQLSTIVSVLLGYRIFKEQDIRKKLIGAAIMIVGSIIITLLK